MPPMVTRTTRRPLAGVCLAAAAPRRWDTANGKRPKSCLRVIATAVPPVEFQLTPEPSSRGRRAALIGGTRGHCRSPAGHRDRTSERCKQPPQWLCGTGGRSLVGGQCTPPARCRRSQPRTSRRERLDRPRVRRGSTPMAVKSFDVTTAVGRGVSCSNSSAAETPPLTL